MIDKLDSKVISLLRFPLIVGVVCIHSRMGGGVVEALLGNAYGIVAVPMFLAISGYLFFPSKEVRFGKELYITKLKRRAKSLLIPYLLWNLIAYICYAIGEGFNTLDFIKSFWVIDIPGRSGSSPIDGPLWYVRNLMLIMIASPIIYYFIKHKIIVLLLIMAWVTGISPFDKGIFIAITFFTLGGYLRYNSYSVSQLHGYWYYAVFCVAAIMLLFIPSTFVFYLQKIIIISGMLTLVSIAKKLPNTDNKIYNELASATFFIYCCHDIILTYIKPIVSYYSTSWIAYLLLVTGDIICCLVLYVMITKLSPKFSKFLTGGR